jgi:ATP-dependent DNA ligase
LYARASSGAVLEWDIEVEGDKYRTITGQQGGNKITSKWTVAKPKNVGQANATTAEDQAYNEAVAKWKKKIKREGYWENVKDIDNTPRFVEPMLAQKLRDHPDKAIMPCMVDKKYNGGRCVIVSDGAFTRKGEVYVAIPHIIEAVAPLFEKSPDLLLDGEGYNHELRFKLNELMSILRTTKGKKLTDEFFKRSEQIVRLYVYDGYGFDCPCKVSVKLPNGVVLSLAEGEAVTADTPNVLRREALKHLIKGIPYLVWVPYDMAETLDDVYAIYDKHVKDGMEGSIIRNYNAPYEHKRSYNLLKVKPTDDSEGTIIAINEGTGNTSGLAATATVVWEGPDGKTEFEATFMGSIETRQEILKNPDKWIDQEVTFLYNGLTGKFPRKPNYARIDPDNCFQGKK